MRVLNPLPDTTGDHDNGIPSVVEGRALGTRPLNDSGSPLVFERNEPGRAPANGAALAHAQPAAPILICMLGEFGLLAAGHHVAIRSGGKTEALLCYLGLHNRSAVPRAALVQALWPTSDPALGAQSLNSLIYQLHKLVGAGLGGAPLVAHDDGQYRLNLAAGVEIDAARFEHLAEMGDQCARSGDRGAAIATYARAVEIYRGDLCVATDVQAILVRERLRSRFLTILAQLADHHYQVGDYTACLRVAWRLLEEDPCREDAHRLVMRCYVKRGERAAALRHYHTCEEILRIEIDAAPEPATQALLEQIRLQPNLV